MFSKKLYGERLRSLRMASGESQLLLGTLLSVTRTQISDMESGKRTTTLEKLALICEHYQVSADYLLGLTDEPRNPAARRGDEG